MKERIMKTNIRMISSFLVLVMFLSIFTINSSFPVYAAEDRSEVQEKKEEALDGVLICGNCKSAPPAIHTVNCTLMDSCKSSGYGVIVPQKDKTYKFYKLDKDGDTVAYNTLLALKEQGVSNYLSVKITGIVAENSGTYSYSYTNKNGENVTAEYAYDGTISDISSIEYDETHTGFETYATDISTDNISVEQISNQLYTGEPITPDVLLKDGEYILSPKLDYLTEYSENTNIGTATITIKGIGAFYKGERTLTFQIVEKEGNSDLSNSEQSVPKLKSSSASLKAGYTTNITVQNYGSNKVKYQSSNTKIAKVNSAGKVTALKKGSADITVSVGETKLHYKVTVTSSPKLSKTTITLKKGQTKTINIVGKAAEIDNSYKNTKIAKITSKKSSSSVKIKGIKKGKTTLKVLVNGVTLSFTVKVN